MNGELENPILVDPWVSSSYLDASRMNRVTYSVNRARIKVSGK